MAVKWQWKRGEWMNENRVKRGWKIRENNEGKRFTDGKCDYISKGEYRRRDIENILRITPSCDHLECRTNKSSDLGSCHADHWSASNYATSRLHTSALPCLSGLNHQTEGFVFFTADISKFTSLSVTFSMLSLLLLQGVMQWSGQARAEVLLKTCRS